MYKANIIYVKQKSQMNDELLNGKAAMQLL